MGMSTDFFTAKGRVQYVFASGDPTQADKGLRQGAKKRAGEPWILVEVPNGIAQYYRAQVITNLINPFRQEPIPHRIHPPKWGAHITVLDGRFGRNQMNMDLWEKYQNEIVEFQYSHCVQQHWKFFTLPVHSEQLDLIRKELGLPPKALHITVGRIE